MKRTKKTTYVAYLLTTFYYDDFEDSIVTEPLQIVDTKEKAYDYFFYHEGGIGIYGIKSDGKINPIMADEDYCLDYSTKSLEQTEPEYQRWKKEHIQNIKNFLKI